MITVPSGYVDADVLGTARQFTQDRAALGVVAERRIALAGLIGDARQRELVRRILVVVLARRAVGTGHRRESPGRIIAIPIHAATWNGHGRDALRVPHSTTGAISERQRLAESVDHRIESSAAVIGQRLQNLSAGTNARKPPGQIEGLDRIIVGRYHLPTGLDSAGIKDFLQPNGERRPVHATGRTSW